MQTYRRLVLLALLFLGSRMFAQGASGWASVERLAAGQPIRVRAFHRASICNFQSADDQELVCVEHRTVFFVPARSRLRFRRAEVESVKLSRRAASTALGAVIGIGAGAGIGAAIDATAKNQVEEGHLMAVLMGLLGGAVGTGIGARTDFLAGPVVYQAP